MGPNSVKCFGVGDGWPSADRNHSAYLYRLGGNSILVDCGEPISRSYKSSGLSYDLIDAILLSHLHFDHVGGFFMLMQSFWLQRRKRDLPIYVSEHGILALQQMLRAGYLFDELLGFGLRFEPLSSGLTISIGNLQVRPFPTSHLFQLRDQFQQQYPQSYTAFSFLIEGGGYRVAHSADIGAPEDLAPLLEKPLDLLVCELAHVEPEALFLSLRHQKIRRILLVHLAREWRSRVAEVRSLAEKILGPDQVCVCEDGYEFDLPA
jgi:ribonuclease Z